MSSSRTSRYVSPDGSLTFVVTGDESGGVSLGFEGYPWHTHADLLAETQGTTREHAVIQFVDDVLMSRAVIAIATRNGCVADVWISDDPWKSDPYRPTDEIVTFRLWDARPWPAGLSANLP